LRDGGENEDLAAGLDAVEQGQESGGDRGLVLGALGRLGRGDAVNLSEQDCGRGALPNNWRPPDNSRENSVIDRSNSGGKSRLLGKTQAMNPCEQTAAGGSAARERGRHGVAQSCGRLAEAPDSRRTKLSILPTAATLAGPIFHLDAIRSRCLCSLHSNEDSSPISPGFVRKVLEAFKVGDCLFHHVLAPVFLS